MTFAEGSWLRELCRVLADERGDSLEHTTRALSGCGHPPLEAASQVAPASRKAVLMSSAAELSSPERSSKRRRASCSEQTAGRGLKSAPLAGWRSAVEGCLAASRQRTEPLVSHPHLGSLLSGRQAIHEREEGGSKVGSEACSSCLCAARCVHQQSKQVSLRLLACCVFSWVRCCCCRRRRCSSRSRGRWR